MFYHMTPGKVYGWSEYKSLTFILFLIPKLKQKIPRMFIIIILLNFTKK